MSDREKAIRILEGNYKDFVLRHNGELLTVNKLIALLKEQEPRVLTLDEADAAEVVWFEARNHIFIEPMLTRGQRLADEAEDWFQYGRDWRCWSARPTDKQREEAPWDEITG